MGSIVGGPNVMSRGQTSVIGTASAQDAPPSPPLPPPALPLPPEPPRLPALPPLPPRGVDWVTGSSGSDEHATAHASAPSQAAARHAPRVMRFMVLESRMSRNYSRGLILRAGTRTAGATSRASEPDRPR